jgi:3'(2'), 5'-bisphosphate nucleotidase
MSRYQKELQLASDLVRKASEITEWFRETGFKTIEKKDHSPVTLADYASQIFINHNLKYNFSSDQLIAEEHLEGLTDKQEEIIQKCFQDVNIPIKKFESNLNYQGNLSNRQWTIDPIDGTKGFIANLSYSIGIGFLVNSEPSVCAIGAPNYNKKGLAVFRAEQGEGAEASYAEEKFIPVKTSSQSDIKKSRVCISLHNASDATLDFLTKIGIKKKNQCAIDGMGKFCMVADATADFYIHLNRNVMYSWDFCPGDLLIRESGGNSSDIFGNRLKFKERNCIITAAGYLFSNNELPKKLFPLLK